MVTKEQVRRYARLLVPRKLLEQVRNGSVCFRHSRSMRTNLKDNLSLACQQCTSSHSAVGIVCSTKQSRFALQNIQQGSMGNQCLVPSSNFVEKCVRIDHRATLSVTFLRFPDLDDTSWLRSKLDLYFALILAQNASWLLAIASPWRDVLTSALERSYRTDVWEHPDTSRNW